MTTAERLSNVRIRLIRKQWSDAFEAERLPGWIAFYEKMFKDYGYQGYRDTADL